MTNVSHLPVRPVRRPASPVIDAVPPPSIGSAIKVPVIIGSVLIALFIGGFVTWSLLAPIASGAIAPGVISPDGSRRTIQHLEGGIIAEIIARDGDFVEAGAPVMVLESVQASATNESQREQYLTLLASQARLTAEMTGADTITFPDDLMVADPTQTAGIIAGQRTIFASRQVLQNAQKQVLIERASQLDAQIAAVEAQMLSIVDQIDLINQDLSSKLALLEDGLITRPQVLTLQRQQAELEGRQGEYRATIAEIEEKQGEIQSQLLSIDAERADVVAGELDAARVSLAAITEELNVSEDILNRTVVTAPVSGRVVNSRFYSSGGVVGRGEPILDIVPSNERLLIDARVSIMDIDIIYPGMRATITLSALASFRLPRIDGTLVSVSADRIIDEGTGQAFYLARVEVSPDSIAAIGGEVELVPGMPAEVLIITSERTMAEYFLEPFQAAFRRSFRES